MSCHRGYRTQSEAQIRRSESMTFVLHCMGLLPANTSARTRKETGPVPGMLRGPVPPPARSRIRDPAKKMLGLRGMPLADPTQLAWIYSRVAPYVSTNFGRPTTRDLQTPPHYSQHISPPPALQFVSDKPSIASRAMPALLKVSRLSPVSAILPSPPPLTSFPEEPGFSGPCNGVFSIGTHPAAPGPQCTPDLTLQPNLPRIPRTIFHNGVTFDVARPEELKYDVPVFGERRRKMPATKPGKNTKRKREQEEEILWEAKRRSLFPRPVSSTHC